MKPSDNIAIPQAAGLKPNHDVPKGVSILRQEPGRVNSANEAGGYVDPSRFTNSK